MTGYRHGGFWRRAMAFLIDNLILSIIYFLLILLELHLPSAPYAQHPDVPVGIWGDVNEGLLTGHLIIAIIIGMAYFTYFHGAIGQTPGKICMKLKVVPATGGNMTYGLAFLRWIGYIVSGLPLYLGFIWVAFDSQKQAWHDKIADTKVVITSP